MKHADAINTIKNGGNTLNVVVRRSYRQNYSSKNTFLFLQLKRESVKRFSYREIPTMTSLPSTLTAKTSMKMTFSSDKIHYDFSQENPKITNI